MSIRFRDQVIVVSTLLLAFSTPAAAASARATVYVASTTQLYAAVNDTANAGALVVVAPGHYALDPSQPNGGRLELQTDMGLEGVQDDPGAVVIDAFALTSYRIGQFFTGPIRIGRGVNSVEWLTVESAINGASAAIDTDLPSTIANVHIAHVVAQGSSRGIQLRNVGSDQAGRVLIALLENNLIRDNQLGAGVGIRIANNNGADNATIRATLRGNDSMRNIIGCSGENLNSTGSAILIDSTADRFTDNVQGCTFFAGASIGNATDANDNLLEFVAHGSAFTGNVGTLPPTVPWGGGIVAIGGANGTTQFQQNRNSLDIALWGTSFGGNQIADINL
jgi:hypothetical protein